MRTINQQLWVSNWKKVLIKKRKTDIKKNCLLKSKDFIYNRERNTMKSANEITMKYRNWWNTVLLNHIKFNYFL